MSTQKGVSDLHITETIPQLYNYLTNPDFCDVYYYNGNSFRLFPFQHIRGPIFVSGRRFERNGVMTCLDRRASGEENFHHRPSSRPNRGSRFLSSPRDWVKTGTVGVKAKAQSGEPLT